MTFLVKNPPTSSDDPRLHDWYHTIDLGNGITTKGKYDLRPIVDHQGIPESLSGKTALDIGTAEGFWAFEMERRGADHVVAIDVERWGDFDWLPWVRETKGEDLYRSMKPKFDLARFMRGSQVEHQLCSVYDLSPQTVGSFDVTFCGNLLLHLRNPMQAVLNIRSVTKEIAIISTLTDQALEDQAAGRPWISFGRRADEENRGDPLGGACIYWHFSTAALQELMEYCGFAWTQPLEPFGLPPTGNLTAGAIGYTKPRDQVDAEADGRGPVSSLR
jgi:tRNA (mo5U34)-methyltransferase